MSKFSSNLKVIYTYYQQYFKSEDMEALNNGTLFSEKLIDLYFLILEKINMVLLKAQHFLKQQ